MEEFQNLVILAKSWLEKGALSPKSFAKIVRLNQSISFLTINSCPKTNLFHTEE